MAAGSQKKAKPDVSDKVRVRYTGKGELHWDGVVIPMGAVISLDREKYESHRHDIQMELIQMKPLPQGDE